MKNSFIFLLFFVPSYPTAQEVAFTKLVNRDAVMKKAKAENKFIFIDGSTTWCGPCKMMDRDVYLDKFIGSQMNKKFISVKLQIDQTAGDDAFVKSWYRDASMLSKKYHINAFPTLLFLSPEGNVLYSAVGYSTPNQFFGSMRLATDSAIQSFRPKLEA